MEPQIINLTAFEKKFISLRYYLIGISQVDKSYLAALKLLEFAKHIHVGKRKDGVTPEFQHQIEIAHFIRTLPDLRRPAVALAATIGHDILEDYSNIYPFVTYEQVCDISGSEIADEIMFLSKEYKGKKTETSEYFVNLGKTDVGSIVKGGDRIHNQSSMSNVFSAQKQLSYITETDEHILPMLKIARRLHSDQESAYENIKFVLNSQMTFVKAILNNKE